MSPRTARQNQEVRAVTRSKLLNAALELFAGRGYAATSVDAIADEAGVSAGLLYHHFDSKAALLNAIFEQSLADVQATFAAAEREPRASDRLPALLHSAAAIMPKHRQFWAVWYGLRMQQEVLKSLGPSVAHFTDAIVRTLERYLDDIRLARRRHRSAIALRADRRALPALRPRSAALSARAGDRSTDCALRNRGETMKITLGDGEMHYVDEGSGPPILLVHGTPTNSYEYRHLIAALSKRFRCMAPDHLGFGQSSRPQSFAYTPEAHAAVLKEFVERLGLEEFTLVVHDFGGPIGLPLAARDMVSRARGCRVAG